MLRERDGLILRLPSRSTLALDAWLAFQGLFLSIFRLREAVFIFQLSWRNFAKALGAYIGYDEIYDRMDYISIDSPMARALLRKEVDDEAIVQTPGGEVCWWITGIEYVK